MDYVQIAYDRNQLQGLPGSLTGLNDTRLFSFLAAAEIPFGRVISAAGDTLPRPAILGGGQQAATAGYMTGAAIDTGIATFAAITNGGLKVTIDGTAVSLTALDFSSCLSYADVAGVINTALSTNGSCAFSPVTGAITITSATTGASSSVTKVEDIATYTSIIDEIGFGGSNIIVPGKAQYTPTVLGVSVRSVTVESKDSGANSNLPVVKVGDVGCYIRDGTIKVEVMDACTIGGSVYYDATTGQIYAASSGHTALGSAKFMESGAAGQVVMIDVTGLR